VYEPSPPPVDREGSAAGSAASLRFREKLADPLPIINERSADRA
jgi:hypothetical protein